MRGSAGVAVWTLVSRVVGLGRVLVIGALMGPTYLANAFQAGYVLPSNVFTVMAGPVLGMVVVPALVRSVAGPGIARGHEVLGLVAGRLLVLAGLSACVLVLVSPLLAWSLVFGVPAAERGQAWLLTVALIVFVAPQVVLYTVAELGVAAQQTRGRFALAAAAPAVESIGTITTVAIASAVFGTGLEVTRAPVELMIVLGVGTTASVAAHAALQVWGTVRAGVFARPRRGWRQDPEARECLRRIARSIPVAAGPAITNYLLAVVAATVPGGVLVVQLSYQVFYALSFLGARAVAMVAMPRLAAAAAARDEPAFAAAWRHCLFYAVAAATPLLILLATFAMPTADLLANGALRHSRLITDLGACLVVVAVAQLIAGLHDLGRQALFATLDDRSPRRASVRGVIVVAVVAVATLLLPADGTRLLGLVLAILAGEVIAAGTVLRRLRTVIGPGRLADPHDAMSIATASAAAIPAIVLGWWLIVMTGPSRWAHLVILLGCGTLTVVLYAVVLRRVGRRVPTTGGSKLMT